MALSLVAWIAVFGCGELISPAVAVKSHGASQDSVSAEIDAFGRVSMKSKYERCPEDVSCTARMLSQTPSPNDDAVIFQCNCRQPTKCSLPLSGSGDLEVSMPVTGDHEAHQAQKAELMAACDPNLDLYGQPLASDGTSLVAITRASSGVKPSEVAAYVLPNYIVMSQHGQTEDANPTDYEHCDLAGNGACWAANMATAKVWQNPPAKYFDKFLRKATSVKEQMEGSYIMKDCNYGTPQIGMKWSSGAKNTAGMFAAYKKKLDENNAIVLGVGGDEECSLLHYVTVIGYTEKISLYDDEAQFLIIADPYCKPDPAVDFWQMRTSADLDAAGNCIRIADYAVEGNKKFVTNVISDDHEWHCITEANLVPKYR